MQKSPFRKLLAGLLASLMLAGTLAALPAFAAEDGKDSSGSGNGSTGTTEIKFHDDLAGGDAGNPYKEYLERHKADKAEKDIVISARITMPQIPPPMSRCLRITRVCPMRCICRHPG